jgi:hypothetical protein
MVHTAVLVEQVQGVEMVSAHKLVVQVVTTAVVQALSQVTVAGAVH